MSKKMMLLAAGALTALAFAALPAVASAGEPEITCAGKVCGKFTTHSGATQFSTTAGLTVNCASSTGTGEYTTTKTGNITLTFHTCKESIFGSACTSPGQPSGTVKTASSVFHNTYLTPTKTTPGVLITAPTGGPYVTFTCLGFFHIEVTGNILGHLESPACGGSSATHLLNFEATSHGQQKYKHVTGITTNPTQDLHSRVNGGAAVTSAMNGTGKVTFTSSATVDCV